MPSTLQNSDGTNGTRNLIDKFIVGAGNLYNVGDAIGSLTHNHTTLPLGYGGSLGVGTSLRGGSGYVNGGSSSTTTSYTTNTDTLLPPYVSAYYAYHKITGGIAPLEIVIWNGLISDIPAGYSLCNGGTYNGVTTPDWRDRMTVGGGNLYGIGTTGGQNAHGHTKSIGQIGIAFGVGSGLLATGDGNLVPALQGPAILNLATVASLPPFYANAFIMNTSGVTLGAYTGMTVIWNNSIASIPAGWAINTTLKDRILAGAKQDQSGVAKTNISGSLLQSGGATTHTGHGVTLSANCTLAGGSPGNSPIKETGTGSFSSSGSIGGGTAPTSDAKTNFPPTIALPYITKQ
jgi:hypothetical protein